ncbi:MAG TPA: hypothetical protein V6D10_15775 [Trichocoleus sp.]|jgi:hypothetical protein
MSQQSSFEPDQTLNISSASIKNSQIGQAGRDLTQINIVLNSIAELGQLASESTSPLIREIFGRVLEQTNYFLERIKALRQAEQWLTNKDFRLNLAFDIAGTVLNSMSFSTYPTPEVEREAKAEFVYNLYDCLCWLLEAFQSGIAKEFEYDFKLALSKYPLELYIHALRTLKRRAKKDLGNKVVSNIVSEYVDMLMEQVKNIFRT